MMRLIVAGLAACSLLALTGCHKPGAAKAASGADSTAANAIDGTWKADLSTLQIDSKPDRLLLQNGVFACETCTPALTVAADGAFHPVKGQPYADSVSVKIVDARTVTRIDKKDGRVTGQQTLSVSPDGKVLTISVISSAVPNAKPVTGSVSETRAAAGKPGSHAISGSWVAEKVGSVSDEALTFTLKLDGDTLHMSSPAGVGFDAKLDGSESPVKGDISGGMVSVIKTADGGFEQTTKRAGKILSVTRFTPRGDGKMAITSDDRQGGSTVKYVANKQS